MGGAAGHLQHLHENRDLTFAELKGILRAAAAGKLQKVTEKLDGMNLVFSWDVELGDIKVARSAGDIGRGGMTGPELAAKFADRGHVLDAFTGAFKVLRDAIGALSDKDRERVFGPDKNVWYSVEVVYSKNPNLINYDSNWVVFHETPVFKVDDSGRARPSDDEAGVDMLTKHVKQMQAAVTQRSWKVRGPAVLRLKKLSDQTVLQDALDSIKGAQDEAGVDDDATIRDYLRSLLEERVAELSLDADTAQVVVDRCLADPGAPTLTDIKRMVPAGTYPTISSFVKDSPTLLKKLIAPVELAVHAFAIQVLKGLHSVMVPNQGEEIARLKDQVKAAIQAIESSGDETAMDVLHTQMNKLGSIDNISSAIEGVVFVYRGKTYKFTGSFAPVNQILGLFRHGRSNVDEARLRSALDRLTKNAFAG